MHFGLKCYISMKISCLSHFNLCFDTLSLWSTYANRKKKLEKIFMWSANSDKIVLFEKISYLKVAVIILVP